MRLPVLNRKLHSWISVLAALPMLVIIVTGLLLHFKKDVAWIQPPERRGAGGPPSVAFEAVLAACRSVPQAGIATWDDVQRIDVRPSKGMLKVVARGGWEVQVDAATGAVLQAAYRRSDLLEGLHDGSFFSDGIKRWLFLPAGAAVLLLWITGVVLFVQPRLRRRADSGAPSGR